MLIILAAIKTPGDDSIPVKLLPTPPPPPKKKNQLQYMMQTETGRKEALPVVLLDSLSCCFSISFCLLAALGLKAPGLSSLL